VTVYHRESSVSEQHRKIQHEEAVKSAAAITFVYLAQKEELDGITIVEHSDLFPLWDENWRGKVGSIVQDDGQLYRSIHDVTNAGQNTKPSTTPAMWTLIGNPAEEWPAWMQPIGAHDAYDLGAKSTHKNKRWISNVGGNIWEPGVYGWDEVTA